MPETPRPDPNVGRSLLPLCPWPLSLTIKCTQPETMRIASPTLEALAWWCTLASASWATLRASSLALRPHNLEGGQLFDADSGQPFDTFDTLQDCGLDPGLWAAPFEH
jgi:hypothetical protein